MANNRRGGLSDSDNAQINSDYGCETVKVYGTCNPQGVARKAFDLHVHPDMTTGMFLWCAL